MATNLERIRDLPILPDREDDAHKGHFGRVLIIAGSLGMAGAPSMVGLAALRSGAGLVTIAVPRSIIPVVASVCPCATTIPLPETDNGLIEPINSLDLLRSRGLLGGKGPTPPPNVIATGPGLGQNDVGFARGIWTLIDAFRHELGVPTVVDADALNLAAALEADSPGNWFNRVHDRTIITPHPGELARLLSMSPKEIQSDREKCALEIAGQLNAPKADPLAGERGEAAVCVLKGAGTIVTNGNQIYVNETGNPGMATGGSGDVLTGVIAGLLGQGLTCLDASVLGGHVHGLAGDAAADEVGDISLIATDVIECLPWGFEAVKNQS
jgi:NAD(P)H-hydrate epimerase